MNVHAHDAQGQEWKHPTIMSLNRYALHILLPYRTTIAQPPHLSLHNKNLPAVRTLHPNPARFVVQR
jgi:hypothetical protein